MKNKIFTGLLLLLICSFLFGQRKKGDSYLDRFLFEKAIKAYQIEVENGNSNSVASNLAKAYRLHRDFEKAEEWYAKAIKVPRADKMDYYYYAQMLITNEKYEQGIEQMKVYKKKSRGLDSRPTRYLENEEYYKKLSKDLGKYKVENFEAINTEKAEFSPAWFKDSTLLITSTGMKISSTKEKRNWNSKSCRCQTKTNHVTIHCRINCNCFVCTIVSDYFIGIFSPCFLRFGQLHW